MSGWPLVDLAEISDISAGNPAPQGAHHFSGDGAPFVRMQDVGRTHINPALTETTDRVSPSAIRECGLRLYPAGTLLVPKSGASVNLNHRAMLGTEAYVVSHLATIIPDQSKVLPSYLFHWSRLYDPRSQAQVTSLPSLPLSLIKMAKVPLPPLDEQRRIVALLDRAEAIRRRADTARQTARALIPALFTQTFGDPATLRNRFPSSSMHEVIASKQLGVVRSTREQPDDGALGYVRMNAITTDGRVVLDELRRTNASEKDIQTCELRDGDLLFNTRNSIELVGKMGIYRGGSGNVFNNNIMRIRLHKKLMPEFLNSYFLSSQGRAAIESVKKGTTSVCAVYYKDLAQVQVPLPPLPLQTAFAAQTRRIEAMASTLDAAAARAETVAAALSARLFGQIRPPA